MSETDDSLEVELQALLSRVLSRQFDDLTKDVNKLSGEIRGLSSLRGSSQQLQRSVDDTRRQLEELTEKFGAMTNRVQAGLTETRETVTTEIQGVRHDLVGTRDTLAAQSKAQTDTLNVHITKDIETLAQLVERLHTGLGETRTAMNVEAQRVRQEFAEAREMLPAELKKQAETLTNDVTTKIDFLGLALDAVQQHADERSAALDQATARLAQAIDETNTLTRGHLSELERKVGLLTRLNIVTIVVLVAAVVSAGAIVLCAAAGRFPI